MTERPTPAAPAVTIAAEPSPEMEDLLEFSEKLKGVMAEVGQIRIKAEAEAGAIIEQAGLTASQVIAEARLKSEEIEREAHVRAAQVGTEYADILARADDVAHNLEKAIRISAQELTAISEALTTLRSQAAPAKPGEIGGQ